MTGKSMEKHLSAQEIGDRKALQIDQTGLRMIDPTKQLGFWGLSDSMSLFMGFDSYHGICIYLGDFTSDHWENESLLCKSSFSDV
jgi:hypothetical protein